MRKQMLSDQELISQYINGKDENIHKLWFLLMFEMWYEKWI